MVELVVGLALLLRIILFLSLVISILLTCTGYKLPVFNWEYLTIMQKALFA